MNFFLLKRILFFLLLTFCTLPSFSQIWSENFDSYPNATTNAPPKWTSVATDCDDGGNVNIGPGASQWGVWDGQFTINDIEGAPCCPTGGGGNENYWTSEVIDLTGYCDVSISLDVSAMGGMECDSPGSPVFGCTGNTPPDNSQDQVVAEYNLDGGGFQQFAYICATNGLGTVSVTGLNGGTLQIRVSAANKANAEFYYFDNVVVNGSSGSTPTFTQIGPLCESDPPVALPGTSNEGVTGSWDVGPNFNPAGLGNTTTTITFTPDPGQCADVATMEITVNAASTPTPAPIGPYCSTDPPVNLPTTVSGITGNWSGTGVTGNTFDPGVATGTITLTFIPNPGQCAEAATLEVTVNVQTNPLPAPIGPYCSTDPPVNLPTTVSGVTGNWSGTGVTGNTFDPGAVMGVVTLTFTPDPGQCAAVAMTSVIVNQAATPNLGTVTLCQTDQAYDLANLQDPSYPQGSWSGPGVLGNFFNPNGQSGNVILTFTSSQACVDPATTTITVNIPASPVLQTATVCQNSGLFDLTTLQDPNYPAGTWSGPGVSGTNFNPVGQNGVVTVTFTPSANCTDPGDTQITIEIPITPSLQSATTCQNSGPFDLTTLEDPLYPGGMWSGPGVTGTNFNPGSQNGVVNLVYTPPGDCVEPGTTTITVEQPGTPVLGTAVLCQTQGLFNLFNIQDPDFPLGTWSGPGVNGVNFDPSGQSGNVNLTFTPDSDCDFTATTFITVNTPATPQLGTTTLCQNSGLFDLTQLNDPNYFSGTWSGPGVNGNIFDPSGQQGNVALVFTSDEDCVFPATTEIQVTVPQTPQLGTVTLCETSGPYNLSNLADPDFPAGAWSGPGVTGNSFDPAGQSGNVQLIFTPSADCTLPAATSITVELPVTPQLDDAEICRNEGVFNLNTLLDPAYPTGTWSGPGVTGSEFNPAGQSGAVELTFTSDEDCTLQSTTTVQVNLAPDFSNQDETCDLTTQTFTVNFDITGGTSPYTVDGNPVAGNTFTSMPMPSGTNYSFELDDANGCGPVTISGVANCNCGTDAGGMNFTGAPLRFCIGEDFTVAHNGNEMLDVDDLLQFVLHDNAGTQLGNILAISNTTTFSYPAGIVPGQTYYVSAIAGSDDGTGNVDLNDPCLSVSQGVQVIFYLPQAQLSAGGEICEDACHTFTVQFTGVAPYELELTLEAGGNTFTENITASTASSTFTVCATDYGISSGIIEVYPATLQDANCITNFNTPPVQTVIVNENPSGNFTATYCPGESIIVNGTEYDEDNPSGTELFPNGSYLGCDSTVTIDLSYYPEAVSFVEPVLCTGGSVTVNGTVYNETNQSGTETIPNGSVNGCDSVIFVDLTFNNEVLTNLNPQLCSGGAIVVNGTTYNASNSSGSETFPGGSYLGCDSTVIINLSFYPIASSNLNQVLCTGGSVTVNGTIYDESNPSGTETLSGASVNGCDSIINVSLTFTPEVTENLNPVLCTGGSVTVNGTIYDESNPTGTETLPGASVNGCDSIINVSLTFNSEVTENLNPTLCLDESILVNGNLYDATNPSGSETFPGGSYLGCDSTVLIDLQFYPVAESFFNETYCTGGSVVINGTVYDENNPTGTEILADASFQGCDSIINVSLTFNDEVVETISETLCPDAFLVINGTQYGLSNPTGTETLVGGSYLGCDSVIMVDLAFYPESTGFFTQTFCTGGSITINGTVYDENNPSGVEVLQNADVNGCDSTVFIELTFDSEVVFDLEETLCPGEELLVNGNTYNEANTTGTELFPNGSFQGCDSIVNISLTFYPEATGNLDPVLLPGEEVVVNGTVYNQGNPSGIEVITGGSYTGCDSTVFISLQFEGEFTVDLVINSPLCQFGTDGSIVIDAIDGGEPPFVISISSGDQSEVTTFPWIFDNLTAGFYVVTIRDANGVEYSEEVFLDDPPALFLDLGDDQTVRLGDEWLLSPQLGFTPVSFVWEPDIYLNCNDCETPVARPLEDITYTLVATDGNGCTAMDEISIFVTKPRSVFAPNAFSPNGDGVNDEFTLFAGSDVALVRTLNIFDRWGALVYEQYNFNPNDLSLGWDGKYEGEEMDPAVFVWFAEVEFVDGGIELFEGDLVLIR